MHRREIPGKWPVNPNAPGPPGRIPWMASMPTDRLTATYRIETPHPLEAAAEALAGEQSCGTFVAVPGETAELRECFRARRAR